MITLGVNLASALIIAISEKLINYFSFDENIISEVIKTSLEQGFFMEIADIII